MQQRRNLIEGLAKSLPDIDPAAAAEFITGEPEPTPAAPPVKQMIERTPRSPFTTRLRKDIADALKRASLERELNGEMPFAVQEILDEALLPWLQRRGYLK